MTRQLRSTERKKRVKDSQRNGETRKGEDENNEERNSRPMPVIKPNGFSRKQMEGYLLSDTHLSKNRKEAPTR